MIKCKLKTYKVNYEHILPTHLLSTAFFPPGEGRDELVATYQGILDLTSATAGDCLFSELQRIPHLEQVGSIMRCATGTFGSKISELAQAPLLKSYYLTCFQPHCVSKFPFRLKESNLVRESLLFVFGSIWPLLVPNQFPLQDPRDSCDTLRFAFSFSRFFLVGPVVSSQSLCV